MNYKSLNAAERGFTMEKIFEVPNQYTTESYLKELIFKGLHELYGENLTKEVETRAEYEIQLINSADMSEYFLIAWDTVNYAKTHDIPVGTGRGSLGNSIVAYALKITEIDPIKYNLPCERFFKDKIDKQQDINIDLGCYSRDKIIEYIVKKYGADKVCSIICQNDSDYTKLFAKPESVKSKLKLNKHTHVSGVIISAKPLNNIIPIDGGSGWLFKAFSDTEFVGYRYDFLEFRYLNLIDNTVREIKSDFDINNIPLDDKATFDMVSNCDTKGVFNFGCEGMLKLLKRFNPKNIEDLSALIALYRPSPLMTGLFDQFVENSTHPHYINSTFEQILKNTYGTIVYQEQLMQILQVILNCSLFDAHEIRVKLSKLKETEELKEKFINGALKQDISEETAKELFNEILSHIHCYFNKAHSIAYAIITYRLAYLKCYYPKEFEIGYKKSEFSD